MKSPIWMVTRALLRSQLPLAVTYWSIIYSVWAVVISLMASADVIEASMWQNMGLQAPRWFAFVFGIVAVGTALPIFVAQGVTRRHSLLGAWGFFVPYATGFAALTAVGFVVERLVFQAAGVLNQLTEPLPVISAAEVGAVWLHHSLVNLGYMLTGALVAVAYYRINPWWATLLLPLVFLPAFAVETAFGTPWTGYGLRYLFGLSPGPAVVPATAVALVVLAVAAGVGWLLIRRLPLTKISG
ncbi:hypothetical protein ACN27F_25555 [Solwaraspora sp. WMMB335]|uniref:hypothetical protein n=1 Tax=Solwaraspora sp. WMMB335 TaxID=3404118 RepID=UPI003B93C511